MSIRVALAADFIFAYHGTDASVVSDVLAGHEQLEPSRRGYDWLGDGIYFWEDDPLRALWWAQRSKEESIKGNAGWGQPVNIETPAVLGAIIYVGECLDLTHASSMSVVQATYEGLVDRYQRNHRTLPSNSTFYFRTLDCLVVNETCRFLQRKSKRRVDTIRGVFVDGSEVGPKEAFPGSFMFAQSYRALCVRSRRVVVDYFAVEIDREDLPVATQQARKTTSKRL